MLDSPVLHVPAKLLSNKLLVFVEGSFCICVGDVPSVTVSVAPGTLATILLNFDNPWASQSCYMS